MIKKLKKKFTILATVSSVALMTVLVLIMNIVNFSSVINESDIILDVLSQPNAPFLNDVAPPEKPDGMFDDFIPHDMSPEVPYESRYFTVTLTDDGEIKESNFTKIISVNDESVTEYINKAVGSSKERGFAGQFRFLKESNSYGTKIMFLDCGRKIDSFYSFLLTSSVVGLLGCIIVFVAFLFVSGRIVRPISEAYEKQKRFISDAGHEIRTPLTIINANVDLLELDEKAEELDEIRTQTQRLAELTNNLVLLSKLEENEHEIQKIEMPISDVVSETANSFQALATSKNIEIIQNVAADVTYNGSPESIRQLVSILMENALKYSPDNGKINITLEKAKKSLNLFVSNSTVEKINAADLQYVFDRFYRTDTSRNSATGGHGIGLSIAKAIVESHGGNISASTENEFDFIVKVSFPM